MHMHVHVDRTGCTVHAEVLQETTNTPFLTGVACFRAGAAGDAEGSVAIRTANDFGLPAP